MTSAVTILHVDDWAWETVNRGRKINLKRKLLPLDTGIPGVTAELSYMIVPDTYAVPRHRHNCDQVRYILSGVQNIGPRLDMGPGDCGFFPEGVRYGPQEQKGDCTCLLLQFQGPSGVHLLTSAELEATYTKMISEGAVFENGIYRGRKADGTAENKDSYTAIWEAHEGRKLEFPKPRYHEPIMMIPDEFRWIPSATLPGIDFKHLGTFTELRTTVRLIRLGAHATLPAQARTDGEIRFLVEGEADYGTCHCRVGTYCYFPARSALEPIHSERGATFFSIELPMLSSLSCKPAATN